MTKTPRPKHFLAFGHSNQTTFRRPDIQSLYDGISIPGTIATYFRQGTGGFVIALDKPYFLDPRTPLFQSPLDVIRASFCTLAEAHGTRTMGALTRARNGDIDLWEEIRNTYDANEAALSWLAYQRNYVEESSERLDYYADLIGTDISTDNSQGPSFFTNPYWMSASVDSMEWAMTRQTIGAVLDNLRDGESLIPIIAWDRRSNKDWSLLFEMLLDVREMGLRKAFIWVNNFREQAEPVDQLFGLRKIVYDGAEAGICVGMLYGGYFRLHLRLLGCGRSLTE